MFRNFNKQSRKTLKFMFSQFKESQLKSKKAAFRKSRDTNRKSYSSTSPATAKIYLTSSFILQTRPLSNYQLFPKTKSESSLTLLSSCHTLFPAIATMKKCSTKFGRALMQKNIFSVSVIICVTFPIFLSLTSKESFQLCLQNNFPQT